MRLARPFDWLARFADATGQPSGYELLQTIQPTVNVDCDCPPEIETLYREVALGAGTNNVDFYPGETKDPTAWPTVDGKRHHARYLWCYVTPGASLACRAWIMAGTLAYALLYDGAAAVEHSPIVDIQPDQRYVQYPFFFRIQILGAAGTETAGFRIARWDRPQNRPLIHS